MIEQPFTPYQLFHLKREKLAEQIGTFYQETRDSATTIQLLLATKVRAQLGDNQFNLFLKGLVQHIFAQSTINRTLRRYFYFFAEYFTDEEWEILSARCFPPSHVTTKLMEVNEATIQGEHPTAAENS